jgi:hypothetical protein
MTRESPALAADTNPKSPDLHSVVREVARGGPPPMAAAVCVVTRFGLRSPLDLIETYLDFLRIRREVGRLPGLLRVSFLIGGMRTCFTVSI